MGRKRLWDTQLRLPINEETVSRIDAVLADDEARLSFIREAIERELARRERKAPAKPKARRG
jgi:hypothetical protein